MQIVIDIDDEDYKRIQDISDVFNSLTSRAYSAIRNGTPLPKGHGKIGDLDVLREEVSSWGINDYEPSDFIDVIDQADTIIEADKTESDSPNFESKEYVEERINNYNNMLKSGILDCITEKPQESEE